MRIDGETYIARLQALTAHNPVGPIDKMRRNTRAGTLPLLLYARNHTRLKNTSRKLQSNRDKVVDSKLVVRRTATAHKLCAKHSVTEKVEA